MAACKICGRTATAALVFHTSCLDDLMATLCDEYCRWPREVQDQVELDEKCSACKIAKMFGKEG